MDRRKIIIGLALASGTYYLSQSGGKATSEDIVHRSPISEQGKEIREEVREQMSGSGGSSGQSQNWEQIKVVSKNGKPSSYRIDVDGDIRRKSNIESGDEISGGVAEGTTTSKDVLEAVGKLTSASISRGTELYVNGKLIGEKAPEQTISQPDGGSNGDSGGSNGSGGSIVDTAEKQVENAFDRGFTFNDDTNVIGQTEKMVDEAVGGGFTQNEDTSIVTEAEDAVDNTVDKVQDTVDAGFTRNDDTNVVEETQETVEETVDKVQDTADAGFTRNDDTNVIDETQYKANNVFDDIEEKANDGLTGDEDTNVLDKAGSAVGGLF